MPKTKIKLGEMQEVYKGKIFTIKERDIILPDGKILKYEYCERPSSVSVLAFNDKNELLMIQELRHGYDKNVWFLPSGRVDQKGDTPRLAAIREMREETGYRPKKIKFIHKKSPSSTLLWDIYLFAAKDLIQDPLPRDPEEKISVHFVSWDKAVKMALDGTIDNEFISYNIVRFNYMLQHDQFHW